VIVTWKPAFLATTYDVVVSLSTGARELLTPSGRSDRVLVPSVSPATGIRVSVVGVSAQGLRGPAATAGLAPAGKHRRHHRHHRHR
jgi:hypothetical protein